MHHAEGFCRSGLRSRADDPFFWIGVVCRIVDHEHDVRTSPIVGPEGLMVPEFVIYGCSGTGLTQRRFALGN
jgi:hypothetical protein